MRVRVVRSVDRHVPEVGGEPSGHTRIRQQLLGVRRIVRNGLDIFVVAQHAWREELLRDNADPAVQRIDDRLPVHRFRERLPHAHIAEWRHELVEVDEGDVQRGPEQDLQTWNGLCHLDVIRVGELHHVDVPGLELEEARGIVIDDANDDLVELWPAAPVAVVGRQGDVVAANPLDELERPGSNGRARDIRDPT